MTKSRKLLVGLCAALLILAAAAIYVLVNLLVDIAYAVIDPRVRTR